MPTAFVLISTESGSEMDVLENLKNVEGVNEIYAIYGVYDVIAKIKAATMQELKDNILTCIRKRASIKSTLTMIAIENNSHS
jgi:DNA-binding Lrp family transcriptional regulator